MSRRVREAELILPALFCIDNGGQISTTELIACLRSLLRPTGEDAKLLDGRSDDKFSQKVRNLKSHKTLERYNLAAYSQKQWQLTSVGKEYLESQRPLLEYLIQQNFGYEIQQEALSQVIEPSQTQEQLELFDEDIKVEDIQILEGRKRVVRQEIYERSARLRDLAIRYYTDQGRIKCSVCDFDFATTYGSHGNGFIEIHHIKPIFSYSDQDINQTLEDALTNVAPVCSNCHRMLHRKRDRIMPVEELREIVHRLRNNS